MEGQALKRNIQDSYLRRGCEDAGVSCECLPQRGFLYVLNEKADPSSLIHSSGDSGLPELDTSTASEDVCFTRSEVLVSAGCVGAKVVYYWDSAGWFGVISWEKELCCDVSIRSAVNYLRPLTPPTHQFAEHIPPPFPTHPKTPVSFQFPCSIL
ncbi:hypothetical protein K469DRAFT_290020 [Zopfia rhizophila CBS 207.26]|uniref:Uncharacterized protein n=1 Tax=Zopfia rhizophila CBS 207.26 TaxID=1314779 RepID=A0A6A6DMI2_9PEZI|nr:hypothetical protein K469DRAFT_290020 [Zopfia rhizophila CBS 207.26]